MLSALCVFWSMRKLNGRLKMVGINNAVFDMMVPLVLSVYLLILPLVSGVPGYVSYVLV